jgi:hypothetical protein
MCQLHKKIKAPKKWGIKGTKWKDRCSRRQKKHQRGQTTKEHQVLQNPLITRSISNKERGGPLESTPSLEEPSLTSTTHFKIETAWARCNTIDILFL